MSKRIKSSIELAMERAAKLPKLTEREIRERREKEYAPFGRVVAMRFLTGELDMSELEAELFKYQEERGEIIRIAFLKCLCESIHVGEAEKTAKVFEGIKVLVDDEDVRGAARRIEELARDHEMQQRRELAKTEQVAGARLRDLGISGCAIRLNLQASDAWCRARDQVRGSFQPTVDEIAQRLSDHLARRCSDMRCDAPPGDRK